MCGIVGWVAFGADLRNEPDTVDAMADTLACRGPDDRGTWLSDHAALGHRRLSVIDLAGGRQPMVEETSDGSVVLVYSGEAYNFRELRDALAARGHYFMTHSDTEVVLRAYLEWGIASAERLNGMYAFAVWDARVQRLVMIRDRMGVKPLYYYETEDGVLFGSEPKAILANPLAEHVVGLDGLRDMFSQTKSPAAAVWEGMREVEPGCVVTVQRGGTRAVRYWSLPTREHTDSRDATVVHVRELLEDIVARQLVSDVPRCTLLSGGLDSSVITEIAASQLACDDETVRSFSVDYAGQTERFVADAARDAPDTPFAHAVSAHAGTEHQDILLDPDALTDLEVRAAVVRSRDIPQGLGDMDTSMYLLFREIRARSTVALSGESADEVFGGYREFFSREAQQARTFPWLTDVTPMRGVDAETLDAGLRTALELPDYIQDTYESAVAEVPRLDHDDDHNYRMRQMSHLYLTRFLRLLLDRKDRLSMAVGLEVRVPFCDHRLVEYLYNVPWSLKTYDGREKSLLRGAAADRLPSSVLGRTKANYPATQDPTYVAKLRGICRDYVLGSRHPVVELVDQEWLTNAVADDGPARPSVRRSLERTIDLAIWLDLYNPTLKI
ncbi:asparagine synthase (glutamine-hydrolyzing) [Pseudonocardia yunnanensis]|uniref:asparagine synthase (glutamine-hydrolyzing) n=1 Tax=Pseudonocardia yunnanensis TaxID=58107 RepID=A0ABW4EP60_9PSEU